MQYSKGDIGGSGDSNKRSVYDRRENHSRLDSYIDPYHYYLVTIKNLNFKFTHFDELDSILNKARYSQPKTDWSATHFYELDSARRLHIHTWMKSRNKQYMNRYKVPNYTVNFKEFPSNDLPTVLNYISKGSQNPIYLDQLRKISINQFQDVNDIFHE